MGARCVLTCLRLLSSYDRSCLCLPSSFLCAFLLVVKYGCVHPNSRALLQSVTLSISFKPALNKLCISFPTHYGPNTEHPSEGTRILMQRIGVEGEAHATLRPVAACPSISSSIAHFAISDEPAPAREGSYFPMCLRDVRCFLISIVGPIYQQQRYGTFAALHEGSD